jgi:hypothetical protein
MKLASLKKNLITYKCSSKKMTACKFNLMSYNKIVHIIYYESYIIKL